VEQAALEAAHPECLKLATLKSHPCTYPLDEKKMNIEQARFNMIEQQIRPWDVLDPSILSLLSVLKREDFVPAEHRAMAFVDTEVPLSHGRFMLSPKVEARLAQELAVHKHERVLVLGANSPYLLALLGHKAQQVTVLESDADILSHAKTALKQAGSSNVVLHEVRSSGMASGLAEQGPFDVVLLAGSVPSVPKALLNQLKPTSGRLLAVVGQEPVMQATLFNRNAQGSVHADQLFDTVASRLPGFDEPSRFQF
jgi:protein-L-isoaspartate(D-aspartate) O-methyltransferase